MNESLDKVIFTWGKYKGSTLGNVRRTSPGYLQWMVDTPGLPGDWPEAARRAINDEDVSDLSLPRVKQYDTSHVKREPQHGPVNIYLKNNDIAYIVMPYNKLMLEQFKYEIDGRKWNGEEKYWEFPAVHLPKVIKLFPNARPMRNSIDK